MSALLVDNRASLVDNRCIEKGTRNSQRYLVELAFPDLEWDAFDVAVPVASEILDVYVIAPSQITSLLDFAGHLEGFEIVRYLQPQDCDCL